MLLDIFLSSGNIFVKLLTFLVLFPALLFALTCHEYAHGYAAYTQGDFYAKSIGCVPGSLFDGLWVRICNDRAFCYGNKEQQRRFDGAGDGEYTV